MKLSIVFCLFGMLFVARMAKYFTFAGCLGMAIPIN